MADYRLLDRWTEGARLRRRPRAGAGPRLRHAGISALTAPSGWSGSRRSPPSLDHLPAHCAAQVVRGGWGWESRMRAVWKNLVDRPPDRGKLPHPFPEGCVFLSDPPPLSAFGFQQLRFWALGISAENQTGSLEKWYGNETPGVRCAAMHVGGGETCAPDTLAAEVGSGILPNLVQLHFD